MGRPEGKTNGGRQGGNKSGRSGSSTRGNVSGSGHRISTSNKPGGDSRQAGKIAAKTKTSSSQNTRPKGRPTERSKQNPASTHKLDNRSEPKPRPTPRPPVHPRHHHDEYMAGYMAGSRMRRNSYSYDSYDDYEYNSTNRVQYSPDKGKVSDSYSNRQRSQAPKAYKMRTASPMKKVVGKTAIKFGVAAGVLVLFAILFGLFGVNSEETREKLDSGIPYTTDCIIDSDGWFTDEAYLSEELRHFYNITGIQPYIVINAYDPSLSTDEEKETYAKEWYEEHIDNDYSLVYMYFGEANETDIGFMYMVKGAEVSNVMDADAEAQFWENVDRYWSEDTSEDFMAKAFNETADSIMAVEITGSGLAVALVLLAIIVAIIGVIVCVRAMKHNSQIPETIPPYIGTGDDEFEEQVVQMRKDLHL